MKTLTFHNDTALDPMAFKVMGLSVKEDNAIGMFGTGLKYAIATTLRLGDTVEIISEGQSYAFGVKDATFRNTAVQLITCNGEELGFTTELGKLWEPWMAYREFLCNAWDEGGDATDGEIDATTMVIIRGTALAAIHAEQDKYFLRGKTPIWSNKNLEVYEGGTSQAFYKGVAVGNLEAPSLEYTFNVLESMTLTEDRTLRFSHSFPRRVGENLASCRDTSLLKKIVAFDSNSGFRSLINYEMASDVSSEFLELVSASYLNSREVPNGFMGKFKELRGDLMEPAKLELNPRQKLMIEKAKKFLGSIGYEVESPIFLIESKGDRLYGEAKDGEIRLTEKAFNHGMFDFCATLLEEWMHVEKGHADYTREMQDWLFRQVISQGEIRMNEIL